MAEKVLRDKFGRVAGYIHEIAGEEVLLDKFGRRLGRYSKARDVTYDKYGRIVGFGDWLSYLLGREVKLEI